MAIYLGCFKFAKTKLASDKNECFDLDVDIFIFLLDIYIRYSIFLPMIIFDSIFSFFKIVFKCFGLLNTISKKENKKRIHLYNQRNGALYGHAYAYFYCKAGHHILKTYHLSV